jgi:hypothetical protein
VAFFGHHVQQHGAVEVLDHRQVLLQLGDVMPVDRPDVAEPKVLEEHPTQQARRPVLIG